tara:strand:+ start:4713 stop:5006 length:294 start_codon:yes stop_codon:yes gene_type:complete
MSNKTPLRSKLNISNNTFINVGTAAQIDGEADIDYLNNKHADTENGLVVSNPAKVASEHEGSNRPKNWGQTTIGQILFGLIVLLIGTGILAVLGLPF